MSAIQADRHGQAFALPVRRDPALDHRPVVVVADHLGLRLESICQIFWLHQDQAIARLTLS